MLVAVFAEPTGAVERIRVAYGVRTQGIGVQDREHGGVQADAKSDGTDDAEGEGGRPAQAAEGVAEVLPPGIDPGEAPDFARLFEGEGLATEGGFSGHLAVDADLLGEVGFELLTSAPGGELFEELHRLASGQASMTRAMPARRKSKVCFS